ncbi:cupin domain-containing protein [Shimwellia pseudoproteus]|uniref:cupin domain-containing protein n=1 Tax=Shimwellia pseudoproteus TaxID=570012 RepID=UPI0018EAB9F8|nr:cupin domain-containing protein [Shimwellia pseudoproteus]MBJ3816886.1 cupin domain-containing protein [Shimwellia pseudoproteus]
MDSKNIHINTPVGEVLVRPEDLDPEKWLLFEKTGLRQYMLWVHPETGASVALLDFPAGSGVPERHRHASNQFMYCLEGEYCYFGGESDITLRPGDFYMNPKGAFHGPTRANSRCLLLEVYDGAHYYEKPEYHSDDTIGKVVSEA